MKKILWLTENYPPQQGGMSESCDRIIEGLKSKGFYIHVVHFYRKGKPFKTLTKQNGTYTYIPVTHSKAHTLHLTATYLENNFEGEADLIMGWGGNIVKEGIYVIHKLLGVPYYFCFRGNDFDVSLFNAKDVFNLERLINNASGIFTNSNDKIQRMQRVFDYTKAYFTPNSIDLNFWRKTPQEVQQAMDFRSMHQGKIIIGLFGFIKEKKGFTFFLNALRRSLVADRFLFLFTGEITATEQTLLDEVGVSYEALENVSRYELIPYYLYCDWLTIPSFYEGMPNVLLEAGGLGIPVVTSAVDGMKDVITDGENGLLFENLNEEDCALKLKQIAKMDEEERTLLGTNLYQDIKENYTLENELQSFVEIL
ncbi:glycosyltransferase family 4 protein [Flammeovirga aprica]|uniref:Glycosyltransferase family 4 protein n=1 Tax=Flammeovirga aprica JL-4 TaxID=694437 RepID=A0A7X9RY81_9BACT|nr:glycosyltransferase family 4 protein [Flammeovirga aprica]NME70952.1 glycosyltransferase family 4 protein [Flammeovirga aprica JL-4]